MCLVMPGAAVYLFCVLGSHYYISVGSVKSRLQNVKSQYQYACWKVLTPELLDLGAISSTAEVSGILEYQLHVERIILYFEALLDV